MSRRDEHPALDSELFDDFAPGANPIPVQNRVRLPQARPKGAVKRSATRTGAQRSSGGAIQVAVLSEAEMLKVLKSQLEYGSFGMQLTLLDTEESEAAPARS